MFSESGNKSDENVGISKGHHMVSVTHLPLRNTTILQTVPSSSFPDKERTGGVTSGGLPHLQPSPESYVADLLNGFGKSKYIAWETLKTEQPTFSLHFHPTDCYVNGTFYSEGSAIASSSFCEYCYCIR